MTYAAPMPLDEARRLSRLHSLRVLDTEPEPMFDALARTASLACEVPIALLSLVDSQRLWFKSNIGLEGVTQTPRDIGFCGHTILQTDWMEVPDALLDPRFADNPLVIDSPQLRFYAGVPIVMPGGETIGTLCVFDRQARKLTAQQRKVLTDLALVAAKALEMRQAALELDQLHVQSLQLAQEDNAKGALYHGIVEDQTDLISLALPTGELTFVNSAYAKHFGVTPEEMKGHNLLEYVADPDKESVAAHLRAVCSKPCTAQGENQMRSAAGDECWIAWTNRSIGNQQGEVVALHSVGRDITSKRRAELALKASQDSFRALYEATPAMLHSIDLQGRLRFVSNTWLAKLGYARGEVLGRVAADFLYPDYGECASAVPNPMVLQLAQYDEVPCQMLCKDGRRIDVLLSAVLERDAQGQPLHSLAVIQDVTEKNAISLALQTNEARLRMITNNLPVMIFHIDTGYRYTFTNDKQQKWFSLQGDAIGKTVEQIAGDVVFKALKPHMDKALAGTEVSFELKNMLPQGPTDLFAHYVPDRNEKGQVIGMFAMVLDRTEQRQAQALLEASERQLRAVTDNVPVLISYLDNQQKYKFVNKTYCEWLNLDQDKALGHTAQEVLGHELYAQRRDALARALQGGRVEFEVESIVKGVSRNLQTVYIPDLGAHGKVHGIFTLSTDVTALKRVEQELRNLARIDALTGLPNRRFFGERLTQALSRSRRFGSLMALMFLDIDHFKSVNDSMGHGAGDLVLCEFAQRIKSCIRVTDTAARLAGDEFVIILEDLKLRQEVEPVANKLLEAVRLPMPIQGKDVYVTTSIGVAFCETENTTSDALIANADRALYRAKAAGRNTFAIDTKPPKILSNR